jgi:hypothetical protein
MYSSTAIKNKTKQKPKTKKGNLSFHYFIQENFIENMITVIQCQILESAIHTMVLQHNWYKSAAQHL